MDHDRIRDLPVEDRRTDKLETLGIIANEGDRIRAAFYDTETDEVFHAVEDVQESTLQPVVETERELGPGERLADVIRDVGEEFGWESLSEFGEENQES